MSNAPVMRRLILPTLLALANSPAVVRAGEASSPKGVLQPAPREGFPRYEFVFESGLGFGLNNPGDYQTAPQLFTLRLLPFRVATVGGFQLVHQVSVNAAAVPFYHDRRNYHDARHAESCYFGVGVGARLVLSKPGCPWELSMDGRFYVGDLDSQGPPFGQGQDLTFSVVVTGGVAYRFTPHLKVGASFLYEHFSNGALSEPEVPNIGLDTIGPLLSATVTF